MVRDTLTAEFRKQIKRAHEVLKTVQKDKYEAAVADAHVNLIVADMNRSIDARLGMKEFDGYTLVSRSSMEPFFFPILEKMKNETLAALYNTAFPVYFVKLDSSSTDYPFHIKAQGTYRSSADADMSYIVPERAGRLLMVRDMPKTLNQVRFASLYNTAVRLGYILDKSCQFFMIPRPGLPNDYFGVYMRDQVLTAPPEVMEPYAGK